jgi:glycerol kinase
MLGCPIIRPTVIESTVQGAAYLAGVTMGLWQGTKDLKKLHQVDKIFSPQMRLPERKRLYDGWRKAVKRTTYLC